MGHYTNIFEKNKIVLSKFIYWGFFSIRDENTMNGRLFADVLVELREMVKKMWSPLKKFEYR